MGDLHITTNSCCPSNSRYGAIIKKGIIPEKGFIIATADFSSLEDRMGANITKDPNKIKVFTEGFDGHCLATSYYFEEELKDRGVIIDRNCPDSVNSIKEKAKDLRSLSKAVTFGANYGATEVAVSKSLNISKDKAKKILDSYWKLYRETKLYWEKVEKFVLDNGYVLGAFGLKARADLSRIYDQHTYSKTLKSIVNMTIQSFALLMGRTIFILQERIEEAGLVEDVKIYNSIHDSIYIYVKPNQKIIDWVNRNLIEIMVWEYDKTFPVKNEAELEIGINQKELVELSNNENLTSIKEKLNKVLK